MKVDLIIKKPPIDKSAIINYQVQIMEQQFPQVKPILSHSNKYSYWDLNSKIKEVISGNQSTKVRWIGNSSNAYLQTYAYILLIGSGHSESNRVQFKHTIYKLGRQCLDLKEQKTLVQFINLIEYSNDRYSFLNKYPQIQSIFIKILKYVEDDYSPSSCSDKPGSKKKAKIRKIKGSSNRIFEINQSVYSSSQQLIEVELQLEQIYEVFSSYFDFIQIVGSNEYSCTLKLFGSKNLHIIIEKDCYFMVEAQIAKSSHFSDINKDLTRDFEDIMIETDKDVIKTDNERKRTIVEESSVIPVERASQIKKPSEKELFNTPKFASFAKDSPKVFVRQFDNILVPSKKQQERSFIEDLIVNVTHINNSQESVQVNSSEKIIPKKGVIYTKMSEIKQMKESLQKVMQKIQSKLKILKQNEHLKSQVGKLTEKKIQARVFKPNKMDPGEISSHNVYNVCQFIKKNRKVSYNEPRPSKNKQIRKINIHNKHTNYLNPKVLNEGVLSQQAKSLPRSKVNSVDGSPEPHLNSMYFSPAMCSKHHNIDFPLINTGQTSNVNVNVNVSINESPLINSRSLNSINYVQTQYFKKYPTLKANLFPSSKTASPNRLSVPQSTKHLNSLFNTTQYQHNPQKNIN